MVSVVWLNDQNTQLQNLSHEQPQVRIPNTLYFLFLDEVVTRRVNTIH